MLREIFDKDKLKTEFVSTARSKIIRIVFVLCSIVAIGVWKHSFDTPELKIHDVSVEILGNSNEGVDAQFSISETGEISEIDMLNEKPIIRVSSEHNKGKVSSVYIAYVPSKADQLTYTKLDKNNEATLIYDTADDENFIYIIFVDEKDNSRIIWVTSESSELSDLRSEGDINSLIPNGSADEFSFNVSKIQDSIEKIKLKKSLQ